MVILPPELINEILFVLPVKSLLRFRCVSKSFYNIIDSKDFIYRHLHSSSEKRLHRKLISNIQSHNLSGIFALDINNGSVGKIQLNFELPSIFRLLVASCNGLVLLYLTEKVYCVWNPATGKYQKLPYFPGGGADCKNNHSGFGYDSTIDDYKILQILKNECRKTFPYKVFYEVWIFELRSYSWRKIKKFPYIEYADIHSGRVGNCFVDGHVYFLCYGKRRESHIIVAFDVVQETFSVVPEPIYENQVKHILLSVFEGCFSITAHTQDTIELYVRKKEETEFTWTKLLSVVEDHLCPTTLGYSKGGDKVLFFSSGNIYSCDLNQRRLQKTETSLLNEVSLEDLSCYILCIESLVSLREEYASKKQRRQ